MAERVGVTVLLPRNTEQWHLFMCDKQVFTLLTAVPYGTEVLSPCLPLASSIPGHRCQPLGCSLPHLLLHAWWIFWQEHRDIFLGDFFASLPATLMLLCTSGADFYHYADETERPVFLGNTQAC